jgi:hypothetical protein
MGFVNHISQMDEKIWLSLKDFFHQLGVYLLPTMTVSYQGKLKGGLDGQNPFNALADLSDRTCIRGKGDEKDRSKKEQALHPVRNDAPPSWPAQAAPEATPRREPLRRGEDPLFCGGVRSQNHSGGVDPLRQRSRGECPAGISNGAHHFSLLK